MHKGVLFVAVLSPCVIPHIENGWDMIQRELQNQLYNASVRHEYK